MERIVERFQCWGSNGELHTIICTQDVHSPGTGSVLGAEVLGLLTYRLESGRALNLRDGGERFETTSGESFQRIR